MLVFSLGTDEAVVIGDDVAVKVLGIDGDEVWLEIDRPDDVPLEQGETNWLSGELEAML
jgi:carbon storage regulator CsrA